MHLVKLFSFVFALAACSARAELKEDAVYVPSVPGALYRTSAALVLVGADHPGETAFAGSSKTMQRILVNDWKFPKENVRVRNVRSAEEARREAAWLIENTTDEDRVMVVYISHGVSGTQGPVLDLGLGKGGYRMDEAASDFGKVKARHKLLVLDACRSGDATVGPSSGLETDGVKAKAMRSAGVILTSDPGRDGLVGATKTRFVEAMEREAYRAASKVAGAGRLWISDIVPGEGLGFVRFGTLGKSASSQFLLNPFVLDKAAAAADEAYRQLDPKQEAQRREQVERAREALGGELTKGERAVILLHLAVALSYDRRPPTRRDSLREAVSMLQSVPNLPEALARDHRRALALGLYLLGEIEGDAEVIRNAIDEWQAVLQDSPRAHDPTNWAKAQSNLGIALSTLGKQGDARALRSAIMAHRLALEVYTPAEDPEGWALAQNNLGNALTLLGMQGDVRALKDAVSAYRLALEVYTREERPESWAQTQNNLGGALTMLGDRGDAMALRDAIAACCLALEVYSQEETPEGWALAQNNLGNALLKLGERGDTQALRDAVAAFRLALNVYNRNDTRAQWALTQNNLGCALMTLGERGDTQALRDAVAALRLALEVRTREDAPAQWAMTQNNLGLALSRVGERGETQALRDAVAAFRLALEVFTRKDAPAQWAGTQTNLGLALLSLATQGRHKEAARQAIEAFDRAEEGFKSIGTNEYASYLEEKRKEAHAIIGGRNGGQT